MAATISADAVLDERDAMALTQYMTVLDDVGRARDADRLYTVVSQSGRTYLVDVDQRACECDDAFYRQPTGGCKHVRRVEFATGRREIPSWADRDRVDPALGEHVDDVSDERGSRVVTDGGEDVGQEAGDELPPLHVGDHVTDRDSDDDAPMLVVGLPLQRAATYEIGDGQTVADYNPGYAPEEHVVEVMYVQRTDVFLEELREYAFPRARLELVTPIHDIDGKHRLADAEPRQQPRREG